MNLMESMQGVKGYSDSRGEEEEEEEAAGIVATAATGEESSSRLHSQPQQQDAAWNSNRINHRKQQQQQLELMELTLGSNRKQEELGGNLQQLGVDAAASSSTSGKEDDEAAAAVQVVEKEHMFDKVVTPSDVGKLNRLVIPKQHAEKYFPLDSSSNEKGLLLNFEDRNGKLWRFRYSYWNSSQSYVMTKGWSRFVKEKKLDAGDIVSFHRGIGELYRHRLYIDWRPRTHHIPHPSSSLFHTLPYFLPNHYSCATATATATARLYSLHSSTTNNNSTIIPPPYYRDHHFHHLNYDNNNNFYTLHQHQYPAEQLNSLYYLTSPTPTPPSMSMSMSMSAAGDQHFPGPGQQLQERIRNINVPMIIDSVPVAHHHRGGTGTLITGATTPASNNNNTTGKRLRLFGVNMECASSSASTAHVAMPNSHSLASSALQRLSLPREDPLSSSSATRFGDQKGGTSVLFDLDPSTQYHK